MKRFLLLPLLFLATPVWAGDYTLTLSGDSTAACAISFSTEAESVDGTHPLQDGDITAFACIITEADPDLDLGLGDLQYPPGLDYRVSNGKVTALDLQTATSNELQIGNAKGGTIDARWQIFGSGSVLNAAANRVVIAETAGPVLRVGPSEQYTTLSDAIAASQEGDTILVEAGIYESDYASIRHDLTIKGIGGLANLVAKEPIPNGKGILVINANVTIENLKFSDASVPDENGAGIRHETGTLLVRNSIFENNQIALAGGDNATSSITILGSEFVNNGNGDWLCCGSGHGHGIYIFKGSVVIEDSTFRDQKWGHHIKSRAEQTTVRNCLIDDGVGNASYSVDLPNGGQALLEGNTIVQSASVSEPVGNLTMVSYGEEGNLHANNSLLVRGNNFIDDHPNGTGVYNATTVVVTLHGNTFQDVETVVIGPHEIVGDSGPNNAPVAVDDAVATSEDTSATVDVLANDTDPDGDALTVTAAGTPYNGATVLNQDGTISYTPAAGFSGSDSFIYVVGDGNGGFASAAVSVTVTAETINHAPVAANDAAATSEDTPATVDVLANDTDPDGDALTVTGMGTPYNGATALNPDGTITYTPAAGFSGSDSFIYVVGDGNGGFATAAVSVTVTADGINNAPVAVDDAVSVSQGIETAIYVRSNDTDPDGDTLTITEITQPSDGTAAIGGGGLWVTYTSAEPLTGNPDVFTYTVSDGIATDVGTVTVTRASLLTLAEQAATMAPGEWRQLDTANDWVDVKVTEAELIDIENATGSFDIGGWGGSARVFQAWNGAGWDEAENRWFFFGGGHSSYGGNEVYQFDVDTLTWTRVTQPHPLTFDPPGGQTLYLPEDVNPADGIADTPGAPHTYDSLTFNPTNGELVVLQHKSVFNLPGGINPAAVYYTLDPDTGVWTPRTGRNFDQAQCEYIPERNYTFCLNGRNTAVHDLVLIHDNRSVTDCGEDGDTIQSGIFGHIYRDDDTGIIYDFRDAEITRITTTGTDCAPTYALEANLPDYGSEWQWPYVGVASGHDDKLYMWKGDEEIVVYDTVAGTFERLYHASQSATGPDGELNTVLSKWRYFPTEGVFLGIADGDTATNPDAGLWMWKPGVPATADASTLGTLVLDGSTQSTLSVHMPLTSGDTNEDATAYVEYRESGSGTWIRGVDLFRQHPEIVSIARGHTRNPEGWHGMIFGLTPDTDYEVRVTVADPDGVIGTTPQTLNPVSTKPLPISDYTGFGTTAITSVSQFNSALLSACDGAGVGQILEIAAGTTITTGSTMIQPYPTGVAGLCGADPDNPVVIRGANKATSVIDCDNRPGGPCILIQGSNVIVENLTILSSGVDMQSGVYAAGNAPYERLSNITARDLIIQDVSTYGIAGYYHLSDVYLADNTITGPRVFPDTEPAGGERGIQLPGQDIEIEHNTVRGFIDGIGGQYSHLTGDPDTEQNRSIAIHHNLFPYNADDGVELDFGHRNVAAYHNLIGNTGGCLSFQPIWGGPGYAFKNICVNSERSWAKMKPETDGTDGIMLWNNTAVHNGTPWEDGDVSVIWENEVAANNLICAMGTNASGYAVQWTLASADNPGLALGAGILNVFRNNAWCKDGLFRVGPYTSTDYNDWIADSATVFFGHNDVLLAGETVFDSYVPDFDDTGSGFVFNNHERILTGLDYELDTGSSAWRAGVEIKGITDATPDIGACDTDDTNGSCDSTGTFYGVR